MTTTMIASWFLIIAGAGSPAPWPGDYLGPFTSDECMRLVSALPGRMAGTCRHVTTWMACASPGNPGAGYACPMFSDTPTIGSQK